MSLDSPQSCTGDYQYCHAPLRHLYGRVFRSAGDVGTRGGNRVLRRLPGLLAITCGNLLATVRLDRQGAGAPVFGTPRLGSGRRWYGQDGNFPAFMSDRLLRRGLISTVLNLCWS
jgi:hypothetical protein